MPVYVWRDAHPVIGAGLVPFTLAVDDLWDLVEVVAALPGVGLRTSRSLREKGLLRKVRVGATRYPSAQTPGVVFWQDLDGAWRELEDDMSAVLPDGLELTRTTPEFDETTVPAGLLRAHRTGDGVWGRLVVLVGGLDLAFDDEEGPAHPVAAGGSIVLAPGRQHEVRITGAVRFVVEFHRLPR